MAAHLLSLIYLIILYLMRFHLFINFVNNDWFVFEKNWIYYMSKRQSHTFAQMCSETESHWKNKEDSKRETEGERNRVRETVFVRGREREREITWTVVLRCFELMNVFTWKFVVLWFLLNYVYPHLILYQEFKNKN